MQNFYWGALLKPEKEVAKSQKVNDERRTHLEEGLGIFQEPAHHRVACLVQRHRAPLQLGNHLHRPDSTVDKAPLVAAT